MAELKLLHAGRWFCHDINSPEAEKVKQGRKQTHSLSLSGGKEPTNESSTRKLMSEKCDLSSSHGGKQPSGDSV